MKTKLAVIALASIFISGCASSPITSMPAEPATSQSKNQEPASKDMQLGTVSNANTEVTETKSQEMQNQSIYFEIDKFIIAPKYQEVLQQQAKRMKENRKTVTLEGNSDERGSSEYNLALGDKRANAVRKALQFLGVPATQIKTISFGEEKPKTSCHEEKCWTENRRVDFNY